MPQEYLQWTIAERFGWTLAEVGSLKVGEMHQFLAIEDARMKAKHG